MNIDLQQPPRTFEVGLGEKITMKDCANILLEPDEQVTFVTEAGAQYDVARKAWGFYATPSLNGRLPRFNLRPVLVKNRRAQGFVLLVEKGKEAAFSRYLTDEGLTVVGWLDAPATLDAIEQALRR